MKVIYFYFLAVSFTMQITKTAPSKKHLMFQIDEFIKQLMTSEKFDELADVIADKAVQKIRDFGNPSQRHADNSALRNFDRKDEANQKSHDMSNHDQEQPKYYAIDLQHPRKSRLDEKSKINDEVHEESDAKSEYVKRNYKPENMKEKDSRSREKLSYTHEKHKSKTSRSNEKIDFEDQNAGLYSQINTESIGKLDTQTFLQNQMASKDLELNFKHLKGELDKHRYDVKGNYKKSHKGYTDTKNVYENENNRAEADDDEEEDENNRTSKKQLKEGDNIEPFLSYSNNKNGAHEQTYFHVLPDKNKQTQSSREISRVLDSETGEVKRNKFKYDRNSNEKPVSYMKMQNDSGEYFNENDEADIAKRFIDKVMDKVSQELNHPSYPSKEVLEVGINRAQNDELDDKANNNGENSKGNNSAENMHVVNEEVKTSAESLEILTAEAKTKH